MPLKRLFGHGVLLHVHSKAGELAAAFKK